MTSFCARITDLRSDKPLSPKAPWPWAFERSASAAELALAPAPAWYLGAESLGASGWAVDAWTPQWLAGATCLDSVQMLDAEHAQLGNGEVFRWRLSPKIASNRSWFTPASQQFWQAQPLRLRGGWREDAQGNFFEVRVVWPLTWQWQDAQTLSVREPEEARLRRERGGAQIAFSAQCQWRQHGQTGASKDHCQHAIGFILDGAQGDDDEAHGGHFALMLGSSSRPGKPVTSTDMLVANFYNPDVTSEKGILPAFTPLDTYLCEINAGQQNYRPSCALVLTLHSGDCLWSLYQQLALQMHRLYSHHLHYDHAAMNCTGITMDALNAIGFQRGLRGPSSRLMAVLAAALTLYRERDRARATRICRYFLTEQTRLLPAQAYFACQQHLWDLLTQADHAQTPWTAQLALDAGALYRLHFPQVPSSRAFGREPLICLRDFAGRVPKRRADWNTIPSCPREFPAHLRALSNTAGAEQLPDALTGLTVPAA